MRKLRIDLRTFDEAKQCPSQADLILDIPKPPLSPKQISDMAGKLLKTVSSVPKDTQIELFCAKGKRAALGAAILNQAGYSAVNLGAAKCGSALGEVTDSQKDAIINYIQKNRITSDSDFHSFSDKLGVDHDEAEPIVYQYAHDLNKRHNTVIGISASIAAVSIVSAFLISRRCKQ
jgi:rhodanese-related sulfurtransferase